MLDSSLVAGILWKVSHQLREHEAHKSLERLAVLVDAAAIAVAASQGSSFDAVQQEYRADISITDDQHNAVIFHAQDLRQRELQRDREGSSMLDLWHIDRAQTELYRVSDSRLDRLPTGTFVITNTDPSDRHFGSRMAFNPTDNLQAVRDLLGPEEV
jgi:hypothetical protein